MKQQELQKQMKQQELQKLTLYKFTQQQILFIHTTNRRIYRYHSALPASSPPHLTHLLTAIPFHTGLLYPLEHSTLYLQISNRARSHSRNSFTQQEMVNTFLPLFDLLSQLQQLGIAHGGIHPKNILLIKQQVFLRDWLINDPETRLYYHGLKPTFRQDFEALGMCLLNCAFLNNATTLPNNMCALLQQAQKQYSQQFVMALAVIAKQITTHYTSLTALLQGKCPLDPTLLQLYQSLLAASKQMPSVQNTKVDQSLICSIKDDPLLSSTKHSHLVIQTTKNMPIKKNLALTLGKKASNVDNQNILEKKLKVTQKSAATEFLGKRTNQQEKLRVEQKLKQKASSFGVQNCNKKSLRCSPIQSRLRNHSKKK